MAIGVRRIDSLVPTNLGQRGIDIVRLTGDGAATTVLVTLGADSDIKTIRSVTACINFTHNIPVAGVAASTGFTLTIATAALFPNATTVDIWVAGDGR